MPGPELLRRYRSSALARNAAWMLLGQGLTFFIQGASFILLARMLGHVEYGVFAGAFAFVSNLSAYSTLGSGMVFLRAVSRDGARFREYWGNILLSTFLTGILLVFVLTRLGYALLDPRSAAVVFLIAVSECFCNRLVEATGQVFQAYERMRYTATLNTVVNLLRLLLIAAFVFARGHVDVWTWVVGSLCVSAVALVMALVTVTTQFGLPRFHLALFRTRILEGIGFSISASTISMYNDVDKAVLSHYRMSGANGTYTMAYRLVDMATVPIYAIYSATLPRAFKAGKEGLAALLPLGIKMLRRSSLFGVLGAVGLVVCAPIVPHLLGQGFGPSVWAIRWLCLIPFFRSCHLSAGAVLTGSGHHKYRTAAQFLAAAFNLGINLYLIPRYSWLGAAWASLLTDGGLALTNWCLVGYLWRQTLSKVPPIFVSECADRIPA